MALAFRSDRGRFDLLTLILWFRLGITTLRWRRVPALLQLERYRRKQRTSRPHLYFWFMGVEAGGESAGTELKNGIFGMADEAKLPVYAETSVKRNKTVFERIGFNTYHRWKSKDGILEFWFLRRNPIEG
jgi:hypothetical protein